MLPTIQEGSDQDDHLLAALADQVAPSSDADDDAHLLNLLAEQVNDPAPTKPPPPAPRPPAPPPPFSSTPASQPKPSSTALGAASSLPTSKPLDGFKCLVSGIQIKNPLVPQRSIQDRFETLPYYSLSHIARSLYELAPDSKPPPNPNPTPGGGGGDRNNTNNKSFVSSVKAWGTIIALGKRHPPELPKSGQGNQFMRWRVTDLFPESLDKPVTLFLFGRAFDAWRHEGEGGVYLVRNVRARAEGGGGGKKSSSSSLSQSLGYTLSIDKEDCLLKLGTAASLATCKATKASGEPCTSLVDKTKADYCIFHVAHAEQKYRTLRAELKGSAVMDHLVAAVRGGHDEAKVKAMRVAEAERKLAPARDKSMAEMMQATAADGGRAVTMGSRWMQALVKAKEEQGGGVGGKGVAASTVPVASTITPTPLGRPLPAPPPRLAASLKPKTNKPINNNNNDDDLLILDDDDDKEKKEEKEKVPAPRVMAPVTLRKLMEKKKTLDEQDDEDEASRRSIKALVGTLRPPASMIAAKTSVPPRPPAPPAPRAAPPPAPIAPPAAPPPAPTSPRKRKAPDATTPSQPTSHPSQPSQSIPSSQPPEAKRLKTSTTTSTAPPPTSAPPAPPTSSSLLPLLSVTLDRSLRAVSTASRELAVAMQLASEVQARGEVSVVAACAMDRLLQDAKLQFTSLEKTMQTACDRTSSHVNGKGGGSGSGGEKKAVAPAPPPHPSHPHATATTTATPIITSSLLRIPPPDPNRRSFIPLSITNELESLHSSIDAQQAAERFSLLSRAETTTTNTNTATTLPSSSDPSAKALCPVHPNTLAARNNTTTTTNPPNKPTRNSFAAAFGSVAATTTHDDKKNDETMKRYASLVSHEKREAFDEQFRLVSAQLDQEERLEDQLTSTTEIKVQAWFCRPCALYRPHECASCKEAGHEQFLKSTVKKFWKCHACQHRTTTLGATSRVDRLCDKCADPRKLYHACGMRDVSKNKDYVQSVVHSRDGVKAKEDEIYKLTA